MVFELVDVGIGNASVLPSPVEHLSAAGFCLDSESIDDANRSCLLTDLRWRLTVELENPSTGNLERSVEVDLTVTVIQ